MLAGKGLSTRQIAEVTGRDQSTIVRDLKRHVLPFGAWPKSIMKEGDACAIDGRRGTWQEGEDGYLYCVPTDTPLSGDARPRFMSAEDAQKIKDAAYAEYCERISNEWRGQP
jgi:hypothetical protein